MRRWRTRSSVTTASTSARWTTSARFRRKKAEAAYPAVQVRSLGGFLLAGHVDLEPARSLIQRDQRERSGDEPGTGTGWHTQGRLRPRVGRKARTVGHQWSPLRGLGDLPPQGIAR